MSEKLKPYKTIWIRFISKTKSGQNFLGDKEYPYHVTKLCFEEMIKRSEDANYLCFKIKNSSGYDYRGAEVVWMNYTEPVINSQVSTLTEIIHTGRLESVKKEAAPSGGLRIPKQFVEIIHLKFEKPLYRSDMENTTSALNKVKDSLNNLGTEVIEASANLSKIAIPINECPNSLYTLEVEEDISDLYDTGWLKENPYIIFKNNDSITINEKENNSMFENVFKGFEFGKAQVKTSIYGPAFRCGDMYVSYDKKTENYIDVTDLLLDIENMNYKMPIAAAAVTVGDYILHMHKWVRVLNVLDGERLEVEDMQEKQVITILPVKNVFGFDFYTKLFCFADNLFGEVNAENPFGNLLPLMLMSKDGKNDNLLPFMLMSGGFNGNTQMNPLMMYALMGNKGNDNILLMLMMMNGGNGFNFPNLAPAVGFEKRLSDYEKVQRETKDE